MMPPVRLQLLCYYAFLIAISEFPTSWAKVFDRCELARLLHLEHKLPTDAVNHWVCIAQHASKFNTEAYAQGTNSGSHGLFQINDEYWCLLDATNQATAACNVPCAQLRNVDLRDDLACLQRIYKAHERLTGNGYTAWQAYEQFCSDNRAANYTQDCDLMAYQTKHQLLNKYQENPFLKQSHKQNMWLTGQASRHNDLEYGTRPTKSISKVYDRCELAKELYYKHQMPMDQVPTWVCIAQHESRFNTAAVGRANADGSADHGLFQISDLYWCSHDRYQDKACGLQCKKLLDGDITDDVRCIKRIHTEHTRIAGDGFTAWTVYEPHCRQQAYEHVAACFAKSDSKSIIDKYNHPKKPNNNNNVMKNNNNPFLKYPHKGNAGKVYKRCELAKELYFKHQFSIQDSATWVCISQYESNLNTFALTLNGQNISHHGLFQISNQYWCDQNTNSLTHCDVNCESLRNADILDDVACIRKIFEEHARFSATGFQAWPAYESYCKKQQQTLQNISGCFNSTILDDEHLLTTTTATTAVASTTVGKVYQPCELARELFYEHQLPMEQIPTWVCIAKHESQFNTGAVGRRNPDGSGDFGLFQISDLYWCSHAHDNSTKACNVPCDKLLNNDIHDDVHCTRIIYKEHDRISGDGFNAWSVYEPFCQNQTMDYIASCFEPLPEQQKPSNPFLPMRKKTTAQVTTTTTNTTPFVFNTSVGTSMRDTFNPFLFMKKLTNSRPPSLEVGSDTKHPFFYREKYFESPTPIVEIISPTIKPFLMGEPPQKNPFLYKYHRQQQQQQQFIENTSKTNNKTINENFNKSINYINNPFLQRNFSSSTSSVNLNKQEQSHYNKEFRTTTKATIKPYTDSEYFRKSPATTTVIKQNTTTSTTMKNLELKKITTEMTKNQIDNATTLAPAYTKWYIRTTTTRKPTTTILENTLRKTTNSQKLSINSSPLNAWHWKYENKNIPTTTTTKSTSSSTRKIINKNNSTSTVRQNIESIKLESNKNNNYNDVNNNNNKNNYVNDNVLISLTAPIKNFTNTRTTTTTTPRPKTRFTMKNSRLAMTTTKRTPSNTSLKATTHKPKTQEHRATIKTTTTTTSIRRWHQRPFSTVRSTTPITPTQTTKTKTIALDKKSALINNYNKNNNESGIKFLQQQQDNNKNEDKNENEDESEDNDEDEDKDEDEDEHADEDEFKDEDEDKDDEDEDEDEHADDNENREHNKKNENFREILTEKPFIEKKPTKAYTTKRTTATATTRKISKNDPFSHPFFDKFKEQFKIFEKTKVQCNTEKLITTTTTSAPTTRKPQKEITTQLTVINIEQPANIIIETTRPNINLKNFVDITKQTYFERYRTPQKNTQYRPVYAFAFGEKKNL